MVTIRGFSKGSWLAGVRDCEVLPERPPGGYRAVIVGISTQPAVDFGDEVMSALSSRCDTSAYESEMEVLAVDTELSSPRGDSGSASYQVPGELRRLFEERAEC
jgi:hypothetical protein